MKYKKYPSYKDSGVEWLGDIPENWNLLKNRHIFKTKDKVLNDKEDMTVLSLTTNGVKVKNNLSFGKSTESYVGHQMVYPGNLVFTPRDFDQTPILSGVSKYKGCISNLYLVLETNSKAYNHFVDYYWWGLKYKVNYFKNFSYGIRFSYNFELFKEIPFLQPPIQEQQQIADFLDKATAKIDTLIGKQTKQIELLKEKRQAVISHAVTKGIKSNVKMKDSGVEWLGEIPEHWKVSKLRFLFSFSTGLNITKANLIDEDGIPCVNYGEIHSKYGFEVNANKDSLKYVDKEYLITSKASLLSEGDFVFADTSEDVKGSGNFTHVVGDSKIFAGYHTVIARLINNYNSRYFAYIFDSNIFRTQIQLSIKGVKVFSITQAILKNCLIWFPVIEEQQQIVNYLDEKTSKIDTLIEKSNKSIELLKEKRTALISACVTGKIDVRNL